MALDRERPFSRMTYLVDRLSLAINCLVERSK